MAFFEKKLNFGERLCLRDVKMEFPNDNIQQLFKAAENYERSSDVYNAVKLFKKIIRLQPDWAPPYARLAGLYKSRQDWKATLHYSKKAVALDSLDQDSWWTLGIAATALKKWRIGRSVWTKFGWTAKPKTLGCLRLQYDNRFEIVWMQMLDPARGMILNIPHPASDRRYRDVVLFDRRNVVGHNIYNKRKVPVYDELGEFKRSLFQVFFFFLHDPSPDDVKALEIICNNNGLGFEIWSNATSELLPANRKDPPEFYGPQWLEQSYKGGALAAIAAQHEAEVLHALNSWQIITLKNYSGLERHQ